MIREATIKDLENGLLDCLDQIEGPSDRAMAAKLFIASRCPGNLQRWVYCDELGHILATCSCWYLYHLYSGIEGRIEDLAVHPEAQQRGLGTLILKHAIEQAHRVGAYKVTLSSSVALADWYGKHGFEFVGYSMRKDTDGASLG